MAKTGHPNFDYTISSPWRAGLHEWHLVGNHSGSSFSATDAQTFMTGASSPFALSFAPFISSWSSTVVRAAYYNGSTSAPIFTATYDTAHPAPTPLEPTGAAFDAAPDLQEPLEVCVLLEAQAGLSTRSKPVYMRKYIHACPAGNLASGTGKVPNWTFGAGAAAAATAMGDGSWFGNRVYCSPTGRQPATNDWAPLIVPGNHQMPRGRKRKMSSSGSSLLDEALQLAAAAARAAASELG